MLDFLKNVPVVGGIANNLMNGPEKADQTPLDEQRKRAAALADSLAAERTGLQGRQGPTVAGVTINPTTQVTEARRGAGHLGAGPGAGQVVPIASPLNDARARQTGALDLQERAATGAAPSAAEIAGRAMAARGAAQQFGQAAALQGGMSAGGALRAALEGSQAVLAQNTTDTMANRAAEMAHARDAYSASIQGARGQEQTLATDQAQLTQQGNIANLNAQVNTNAQTQSQREALLAAQLRGEGLVSDAAGNKYKANAADAGAENADTASKIDAGIKVASMFSDRREKTDVHTADLDALAASLRGVGFNYKHPGIEGEPPGHRVGILAQDAQRGGPVGRGMVIKERGEPLRLDTGNALGASLAMAAEALRRTRKAA